ncbi:MAG TPA: hypothetical protein VG028_16140 [Terriglobia bacterium]|nr:hypothetical protein [Terriglobia bacterium]
MDEKERSQFVDDLLEASLSQYGNVTPRTGLEGRVLANARAAQERRARWLGAGWLAAGAAAVLIAIGVLNFAHKESIPALPKLAGAVTTAHATDVGPGPIPIPKVRSHGAGRPFSRPALRGASKRVEDEPHMTVFPSPQPETAEERLLLQYVRTTPPSVLTGFPADSAEIPDLEIKKLDMPPLASDADETKNNL